ncbi:hypothetical protein PKB_1256 [Pseudomonas knackmussii B13]|uniref:Uncharacterized protein n=1 Tax=Pseudomonas knackmussii (strain DSM 6978 / CCUG 54928 / LMG 23759 / B13) TaxID=1301098 RepID=A0A024HCR1_PSEKB|nr:hypothetical protein PKB_1256 [Pseudomonas knackmussii B13]
MTPRIPARRVAAQDQGCALAPATLSTKAPAARKRGGGLARRCLLTLSLAGRPSMPEGGAIESLCCAAAGIFLPKPQVHAGVAYPTTRVRRGAKDAASLRSPTAPHAQLVEGYKQVSEAQLAGVVNVFRSLICRQPLLKLDDLLPAQLDIPLVVPPKLPQRLLSISLLTGKLVQISDDGGQVLPQLVCKGHSTRIMIIIKRGVQPNQHPAHRLNVATSIEALEDAAGKHELQPTVDLMSRVVQPSSKTQVLPEIIGLAPAPLPPGKPQGNAQADEATNRLDPTGRIAATPGPTENPNRQHNSKRRQQRTNQQAARAQLDREFVWKHGHPLAINSARSMPMAVVRVQGVAA